jgi:23S rRNA (adenine2503-C2)-methyltransferase
MNAADRHPLLSVDLEAWCDEHAVPKYRAGQIRRWLYERRARTFGEMNDLPAALRQQLEAEFTLFSSTIVRHQVASDRTEKLLLKLEDDETVECVLMRETGRRTVCISTQVGCGMGCIFCASGLMGVKRNLTTAEILEQVLLLDRVMKENERIANIVVMGMGEPLANLKALMPALRTLTTPVDQPGGGMGLSPRRITVSTVGLPDRMRELADSDFGCNLAVSLHAPNDELRTRIVPVNKGTGIAEILAAADYYFQTTGRRVSYEYVLLAEINDEPHHARELAKLLRGHQAHVNVIPMNAVSPLDLSGSSNDRTDRFVHELREGGINVTIRKRKGADIDAACGQLRLSETEHVPLAR